MSSKHNKPVNSHPRSPVSTHHRPAVSTPHKPAASSNTRPKSSPNQNQRIFTPTATQPIPAASQNQILPPKIIKYPRSFLLSLQANCQYAPPGLYLPDLLRSSLPLAQRNGSIHTKKSMGFDSTEIFKRNAVALLNKLTPENFDSISEKLLCLINEEDCNVAVDPTIKLETIVDLLFEKAIREPHFSGCFSDLCVVLSHRTGSISVGSGPPLTFRRLLLDKCKQDFETKKRIPEADPSADQETKIAIEEARNKLIQRNLGVPKFIGSLFLSGLISESIVHCCLCTLLSPDESDLVNFVSLMTTIGQKIDQPKAQKLMEAYFMKIEAFSKDLELSSRIRFKLQDLIDLKNNAWIPKRPLSKPKTLDEIHRDIIIQKEDKEQKMNVLRRTLKAQEEEEEDDDWTPPVRTSLQRPPLNIKKPERVGNNLNQSEQTMQTISESTKSTDSTLSQKTLDGSSQSVKSTVLESSQKSTDSHVPATPPRQTPHRASFHQNKRNNQSNSPRNPTQYQPKSESITVPSRKSSTSSDSQQNKPKGSEVHESQGKSPHPIKQNQTGGFGSSVSTPKTKTHSRERR